MGGAIASDGEAGRLRAASDGQQTRYNAARNLAGILRTKAPPRTSEPASAAIDATATTRGRTHQDRTKSGAVTTPRKETPMTSRTPPSVAATILLALRTRFCAFPPNKPIVETESIPGTAGRRFGLRCLAPWASLDSAATELRTSGYSRMGPFDRTEIRIPNSQPLTSRTGFFPCAWRSKRP